MSVAANTEQDNKNAVREQSLSPAREIARLIENYLGPNHPPPQTLQVPSLSALRIRLSNNSAPYDANSETLSWQTREAIRTEFFKIIYPTAPSHRLLTLVSQSEIIFTPFGSTPRPFFFPGARVAVPTEAGSRRAATTLQLRFKLVNGVNMTESLLHLDGPAGGGFQWVQTSALVPLSVFTEPLKKPNIAATRPRKKARVPKITRPKKARPPAVTIPSSTAPRTAATKTIPKIIPSKSSAKAASRSSGKLTSKLQPKVSKPLPMTQTTKHQVSSSGGQGIQHNSKSGGKVYNQSSKQLRQEGPGVYVPSALKTIASTPKMRLLGDGRQIGQNSGCIRSTFDGGECNYMLGIQRLVARRLDVVGQDKTVMYFVKWTGVPMKDGSWERREDLMRDVPGLVRDFDIRHPGESSKFSQDIATVGVPKNCKSVEGEFDLERERSSGKVNVAGVKQDVLMSNMSNGNQSIKVESLKFTDSNEQMREHLLNVCGGDNSSGQNANDVENGFVNRTMNDDCKSYTQNTAFYVDDVTGLSIPSWLDTPILEVSFSGMVLQIRRPNEGVLHNDANAAWRDVKKRQTRFKQQNMSVAERLFPLTKAEARSLIDISAKSHRQYGRVPIAFPKGIGLVSPQDQGHVFSTSDALMGPASWEGYFSHLGLKPKDFSRELPPNMPTLDEACQGRVQRALDDIIYTTAIEHRERARSLIRESFRHSGGEIPEDLFRDGKRLPPDAVYVRKRKRAPGRPENSKALRLTGIGGAALENAKRMEERPHGAWYDEVWACWRPAK